MEILDGSVSHTAATESFQCPLEEQKQNTEPFQNVTAGPLMR